METGLVWDWGLGWRWGWVGSRLGDAEALRYAGWEPGPDGVTWATTPAARSGRKDWVSLPDRRIPPSRTPNPAARPASSARSPDGQKTQRPRSNHAWFAAKPHRGARPQTACETYRAKRTHAPLCGRSPHRGVRGVVPPGDYKTREADLRSANMGSLVRRRGRSAAADGGTAGRAIPFADGGTAWSQRRRTPSPYKVADTQTSREVTGHARRSFRGGSRRDQRHASRARRPP